MSEKPFDRWTAQHKAAVIVEVMKGQLSVPEVCRKYDITQGEYRKWFDEFYRGGVDALKLNRKGIEAQYRSEIKRLQAKIGELVMDNDPQGGDAPFRLGRAGVVRLSGAIRASRARI